MQDSGSPMFWSQDPRTHLKIIEDSKEFLCLRVVSINISN